MNTVYRAFRTGTFEVRVKTENDTFVGMCYDSGNCYGIVSSKKSWFDCALKGLSYLRTLNDMPSNYEYLPDTKAVCLQ